MKIEEIYSRLKKELKPYQANLGQASDTILEQDVSSYPIFVVSHQPVEIGVPIIGEKPGEFEWFVNASTLEELAGKRIIELEKVDAFRKVFKDPADYFCLLVWSEAGVHFVFIPRD